MRRPTLGTLLTCIALLGCQEEIVSPSGNVEVSTDASSYSIGDIMKIALVNRDRDSVEFFHCDGRVGFHVQQRDGGTWKTELAIGTFCPTIYRSGILILRPGDSYADSISVPVAEPGLYRLRLSVGRDSGAVIHSDPFSLE